MDDEPARTGTQRFGGSTEEVFPNPTYGDLYIENLKKTGTIEVFNVQGHLITKTIAVVPFIEMELQSLQTGIYFIKIRDRVGNPSYANRFTMVLTL